MQAALVVLPGDLDQLPGGLHAGGRQDAHLLTVRADRLTIALLDQEAVDGVEEIAYMFLEAESQVGGALYQIVESCMIRWRKHTLGRLQRPTQRAALRSAELPQQTFDLVLGYSKAERIGGGIFQVMGFVHDQVVVFRQHAVACGDIRQQQGMVDNDEMGALSSLPGAVEGAGAAHALHTGLGGTAFVFRRDAVEDFAFSGPVQVELTAVSGGRLQQPDQHFAEHADLFRFLEFAAAQGFQPSRTQVVRTPFQHSCAYI